MSRIRKVTESIYINMDHVQMISLKKDTIRFQMDIGNFELSREDITEDFERFMGTV